MNEHVTYLISDYVVKRKSRLVRTMHKEESKSRLNAKSSCDKSRLVCFVYRHSVSFGANKTEVLIPVRKGLKDSITSSEVPIEIHRVAIWY